MSPQLSVRIDGELEERFDEYRESFAFKPDKSVIIRKALDEYLEKEGY